MRATAKRRDESERKGRRTIGARSSRILLGLWRRALPSPSLHTRSVGHPALISIIREVREEGRGWIRERREENG